MASNTQIENLIECFAESVNLVKDPSALIFNADDICAELKTNFNQLIASSERFSILVKVGDADQYYGYHIDNSFNVIGVDVFDEDFSIVDKSIIKEQLNNLSTSNGELYKQVMWTNDQRQALVSSFAEKISESCFPNRTLKLERETTYLTLRECVTAITGIFGGIFFYSESSEGFVVLEFLDDLSNANLYSYK